MAIYNWQKNYIYIYIRNFNGVGENIKKKKRLLYDDWPFIDLLQIAKLGSILSKISQRFGQLINVYIYTRTKTLCKKFGHSLYI